MDQKPSVFPTQQQSIDAAHAATEAKIAAYEAEKLQVTNEIYTNASAPSDTPQGHMSAVEMMRKRTQDQLNQKRDYGTVIDQSKAEVTSNRVIQDQTNSRTEDQMRLRDEQLRKNQEQITNYQVQANKASARNNNNTDTNSGLYQQQNTQPVNNQQNNQGNYVPPVQPPVNTGYGENYGKNPSNINPYIIELSQPNYNSPFDVIPLPSEGKLNRGVKPSIRTGYMTTADENILTSPNLLQSGQFLEILINRKILEPGLRYKDLHVGDRNAIMIWLRATGYGEMYPVTLLDENNIPFDTDINLNELKTKNLGAIPDSDGLFDFTFPLCKAVIKFKLLTCGDIDDIEKLVEADKVNGVPVNNTNTYTMEHTIMEVNGDRNKSTIRDFSNSIRIGDAKKFSEYVEKIESGIDLNIEVRTPGGGSIKTFLPLNINFFWPNVKL